MYVCMYVCVHVFLELHAVFYRSYIVPRPISYTQDFPYLSSFDNTIISCLIGAATPTDMMCYVMVVLGFSPEFFWISFGLGTDVLKHV